MIIGLLTLGSWSARGFIWKAIIMEVNANGIHNMWETIIVIILSGVVSPNPLDLCTAVNKCVSFCYRLL